MADLQTTLEEAATAPRSVTSDGTQVQSHSLPDLIELDRHLAARSSANKPARGLVFTKLVPPGAI